MPDGNAEVIGWIDFEIQQQREAIKIPGWSKYVLLTSMGALLYYLANTLYSLKVFDATALLRGLLFCYTLRIIYAIFHIIKTAISAEKMRQKSDFSGETSKAVEYQLFLFVMNAATIGGIIWLLHGAFLLLLAMPILEMIGCIFSLGMMRSRIALPLRSKTRFAKLLLFAGLAFCFAWSWGMLIGLGPPTLVETQLCLGLFGLFWAFRVYCLLHKDEYALNMFISLRREVAFSDKVFEKSMILERIHNILWGSSHTTLLKEVFKDNFVDLDEALHHLQSAQALLDLIPKCSDETLVKNSKDLVLARVQLVSELWAKVRWFDPKRSFGANIVWTHADEASRAVVKAEIQRRLDAIAEARDKMAAHPALGS